MAEQANHKELKSTGYELFILLLSLVSIADMVISNFSTYVVADVTTVEVVTIIDSILTVFFLFDFSYRIFTASSKSRYFFRNWGWADLLACVPLLRIFRVFRIVRAARLMHGKSSKIRHNGSPLFSDLPNPFEAARYHSLVVERSSFPACLEMTAESDDGEIMAMRHREFPVQGVQFHPESVLTRDGKKILASFLSHK